METVESIVDIFDSSIKKLTSPTLIMVAAAIISQGLEQPDADKPVIYGTMILLMLCAFAIMSGSAYVSLHKLKGLELGGIRKFPLMLVFLLVHIVLFLCGVAVAVGKL